MLFIRFCERKIAFPSGSQNRGLTVQNSFSGDFLRSELGLEILKSILKY